MNSQTCFYHNFYCSPNKRDGKLQLPISLPDMNGLLIHVVVFQCLLIQEVKEIFDSWRHQRTRAQHAAEEVIHKLLQRSLKGATNNVRRVGEQSQQYQSPETKLLACNVSLIIQDFLTVFKHFLLYPNLEANMQKQF